MSSEWTVGMCPSIEETIVMDKWPDDWWLDKAFLRTAMAEHPTCLMLPRIGRTCRENDPDGPGTCHCPHCNLTTAVKEYGTIEMTQEVVD